MRTFVTISDVSHTPNEYGFLAWVGFAAHVGDEGRKT